MLGASANWCSCCGDALDTARARDKRAARAEADAGLAEYYEDLGEQMEPLDLAAIVQQALDSAPFTDRASFDAWLAENEDALRPTIVILQDEEN